MGSSMVLSRDFYGVTLLWDEQGGDVACMPHPQHVLHSSSKRVTGVHSMGLKLDFDSVTCVVTLLYDQQCGDAPACPSRSTSCTAPRKWKRRAHW